MATRARQRLLETSEELFYAHGVQATGLDRILAESGVGRASFYRHFATKEDLVVEVLRGRDDRWREWLSEAVEARLGELPDLPARQRPLAVFDALADRFARQDFRGCAFINTMVEAADPASAAHLVAADHKRKVVEYVDRLLQDAGYLGHAALADQFILLMDGAIVTSVREGCADAARRARGIAAVLLSGADTESRVAER
ncbi:TetR/AcrR family transcriptional regulator [Pseudofrankia inefficax]|uniref:Regulatory protein TetR n=1 Tax=Pseudofrankia inefficax (strain DSM 45817 / CECT 9037 / DDB 130130 / EuI1c) TaxID=298654 RepID=E3J0H7_PSEI1|nr:TetR/AcrR family transcriptional regulator [Pseudofrankia inefficax]ADP81606.1 regulatory protein TetR [Pseudofrankia inefficax]